MKRGDARINVLQLIGSLTSGGAENMVINLANGLNNDLFSVVLSARKDGPASQELINHDQLDIIEKNKIVDLNHLIKLVRLIKKNKIDIIHSHMFGTNMYGFIAAKLTRKKIIQTVHGMDCLESRQRIIAYKLMYRFVDKIITVSESLESEFLKNTKIMKKKICTIHNGIDTDKYSINNVGTAGKKELGLSGMVVGAVGNIKHVKGYDVLLIAASKVIAKYPKTEFVIVGETVEKHRKEKNRLDGLVESLKLKKNIHFLGYRKDVADLLQAFDIYVLPSRSEGLSLSLLEAMASGRAVVATNVGGNGLLVKDGYSGLLIPPENPDVLADQIVRMIKDRDLAYNMGGNAREYVENNFSINQMLKKYENLYRELIPSQ